MLTIRLARLAALAAILLPAAALAQPALREVRMEVYAPPGTPIPRFKVDAAWPEIPADGTLGQVSGVAVDAQDNVWIVQRPNTLAAAENGLIQTPPWTVGCCRPLPPVIAFSPAGTIIKSFGGPAAAPVVDGVNQWPNNMHGMFVAKDNTLWFGGNGEGDHVIFNYTVDGKFIRQLGRKGQTKGNLDQATLGNPADVNDEDGEVMIADGYLNERVIAFDSKTSQFKWVIGAYGGAPAVTDPARITQVRKEGAEPNGKTLSNVVHCVVKTRDRHVYVCDRLNNRGQVYREDAAGKLTFETEFTLATQSFGSGAVTDIAFSPDQKYVYVVDISNGFVWILLRATHQPLARIGKVGRYAGEFIAAHNVATDSKGNLYVTEVGTGQRIQKFVFDGVR